VQDQAIGQKILHFEHATAATTAQMAPPDRPGQFSNMALTHPAGDVVVLLFDDVDIELEDQMYLRLQMLKYLAAVPASKEVAVFVANGGTRPLLVQSLTTDHALLVKAINNSVPKITRAVSTRYSDALEELANISAYLQQSPGRKQLLWFAGHFPLYNSPVGMASDGHSSEQEMALKEAYRSLERARVQVFPIDVRGVTRENIALAQSSTESALADNPEINSVARQGGVAQQMGAWNAMDRIAAETGGKAFYSTNDLASAVSQAVDLGSHAYSISYRPTNPTSNGEWHAVKLTVDGGYALSYRRGYFASDRSAGSAPIREAGELTVKGIDTGSTQPAAIERPITFQARVTSAIPSGNHGGTTLTLQYGILVSDLLFKATGEQHEQAQIKVAALAYNGDGDVVSNAVDIFQTNYDPTQMQLARRIGVPMSQKIEVAKKAKFLLLAVLDERTGRTGTVQLTLDAAKAVGH
jgi:VWFA-related protein